MERQKDDSISLLIAIVMTPYAGLGLFFFLFFTRGIADYKIFLAPEMIFSGFDFIFILNYYVMFICYFFFLFILGISLGWKAQIGRWLIIVACGVNIISIILKEWVLEFPPYMVLPSNLTWFHLLEIDPILRILFTIGRLGLNGFILWYFARNKELKNIFLSRGDIRRYFQRRYAKEMDWLKSLMKAKNIANLNKRKREKPITIVSNRRQKKVISGIFILSIVIISMGSASIITIGIRNVWESSTYGNFMYFDPNPQNETLFDGNIQDFQYDDRDIPIQTENAILWRGRYYDSSSNLTKDGIVHFQFNKEFTSLEELKIIKLTTQRRFIAVGINATCYFSLIKKINVREYDLVAANSSGIYLNKTLEIPSELYNFDSGTAIITCLYLKIEDGIYNMVLQAFSGYRDTLYRSFYVRYNTSTMELLSKTPIISGSGYNLDENGILWVYAQPNQFEQYQSNLSKFCSKSAFIGYLVHDGELQPVETTYFLPSSQCISTLYYDYPMLSSKTFNYNYHGPFFRNGKLVSIDIVDYYENISYFSLNFYSPKAEGSATYLSIIYVLQILLGIFLLGIIGWEKMMFSISKFYSCYSVYEDKTTDQREESPSSEIK